MVNVRNGKGTILADRRRPLLSLSQRLLLFRLVAIACLFVALIYVISSIAGQHRQPEGFKERPTNDSDEESAHDVVTHRMTIISYVALACDPSVLANDGFILGGPSPHTGVTRERIGFQFTNGELSINSDVCGLAGPTPRIVNGLLAQRNQLPWMVFLAVKINGEYISCSGTILTQRNILTAAHCIKQNDTYPTRIVAFYNSTDKLDGAYWRVDRMKVHPYFHEKTFVNDVALLRVERAFTFTTDTRPICISLGPVDIHQKHVRVAGWGRLKHLGPSQRQLYFTSLRVLPDSTCMRKFGANGFNKTLQFCAYGGTTDACEGDSGGPAIARADDRRFLQVGIVSYGTGCADKYMPSVYTRLDAFAPWILKNVLYGTWLILYPTGEFK